MSLKTLASASGKDAQREAALSRTSCKNTFKKAVKNSIHTITKKYSPTAAFTLPYKLAINCHFAIVNCPKKGKKPKHTRGETRGRIYLEQPHSIPKFYVQL